MSDNVCPKCGKPQTITLGPYYVNDFCQCYTPAANPCPICADMPAEIARLKAELEKAESVLAGMETNRNYWVRKCDEAIIERDEARKWAKYWYRAYNEDV